MKEDISKKQEELEKIEPEYTRLVEKENQLLTDIRISEQRCKELYAKQGQKDQFKNKEERDMFLRKEIKFIDSQLDENKKQITGLQNSLKDDETEIELIQKKLTVRFLIKRDVVTNFLYIYIVYG